MYSPSMNETSPDRGWFRLYPRQKVMEVILLKVPMQRITLSFVDQYEIKLLTDSIRLKDLPPHMLRGKYATSLYLTAFRADRGISMERYCEDMEFLLHELLGAIRRSDAVLEDKLENLLQEKLSEFRRLSQ